MPRTAFGPGVTPEDFFTALRPLLAAEAAAEAYGTGAEAADFEQAVWLRLLERTRGAGPPPAPADWLRAAVRAEARAARRRARREVPYGAGARTASTGAGPGGRGNGGRARTAAAEPVGDPAAGVEDRVLAAEFRRALRSAVARLPGRCPRILDAMLSGDDLTYREVAGELGMSQGSLGPVRSRCLGCLRRMLSAEVAARQTLGREGLAVRRHGAASTDDGSGHRPPSGHSLTLLVPGRTD
jgi:RNA polymerase sigma factor (sigma-70 family)